MIAPATTTRTGALISPGSVRFVDVRTSSYYVDNYHQYLAKNAFGYRCHANTGVKFPETV